MDFHATQQLYVLPFTSYASTIFIDDNFKAP